MSDADTRAYNRDISRRMSVSVLHRLTDIMSDLRHLEGAEDAYLRTEDQQTIKKAVKEISSAHLDLCGIDNKEFNNCRDLDYRDPHKTFKRGDRVYLSNRCRTQNSAEMVYEGIDSGYYTITSIRKRQVGSKSLGITRPEITVEDDNVRTGVSPRDLRRA